MKDIELTEKLRSKFVEFELDVDFSDKGLDNLAEACASIAQSYAEDKVKELTLKNAEIHGGYIHELDSLRVDNSKLNDKVKEAKELLKEAKEQLFYQGSPRAIIVERQIKTFLESGNIK